MVHSESRKCKICLQTVSPQRGCPCLLHHIVRRAELVLIGLWIIMTWTFSELAQPLGIALACRSGNHFTKYPCFKADTSMLIRDLCILGTKPRICKEGEFMTQAGFQKDISHATIWTDKILPPPFVQWTTWPNASPSHCPGAVVLCQGRDTSCFMLQTQQ